MQVVRLAFLPAFIPSTKLIGGFVSVHLFMSLSYPRFADRSFSLIFSFSFFLLSPPLPFSCLLDMRSVLPRIFDDGLALVDLIEILSVPFLSSRFGAVFFPSFFPRLGRVRYDNMI